MSSYKSFIITGGSAIAPNFLAEHNHKE